MKHFLKWLLGVIVVIGSGLWVANTSVFVTGLDQHETRLIAHRGVHQIYVGSDRSIESCHASPVASISHGFIENTVASMREAFRLGADVVEIDVHLTPDTVFAVFHDWTLECRTDGAGVTHKQPFAYLQTLDVGFGIDDGTGTFALRGKGRGLMPSLGGLFAENLDGQFLVNFKSRRAKDGTALADMLVSPEKRKQVFGVYGGQEPTRSAMSQTPGLRGFDRASLKHCLLRYAALGWSGYVPKTCRNTLLLIPQNYAKFLWGWPHRLTRRLDAVGTNVVLAGDYDGSGFSSGIDSADSLDSVPRAFDGYIWTNRIELIAPLVAARDANQALRRPGQAGRSP